MKEKYSVLLVDDEVDILEFLSYNLVQAGYKVYAAQSGEEGLKVAHDCHPDLIVLDIMMPKMDGIAVCKALRQDKAFRDTPIIFLTALMDDIIEEKAMNSCGDGYITKPLRPKVFLSHLKAHLRKVKRPIKGFVHKEKRTLGPLTIKTHKRSIKLNGEKIKLAKKEFNLLVLLSSEPGTIFTREQIFSKVWDVDILLNTRTLDVHIREIRKKIGKDYIITSKGVGYKFVFPGMENE